MYRKFAAFLILALSLAAFAGCSGRNSPRVGKPGKSGAGDVVGVAGRSGESLAGPGNAAEDTGSPAGLEVRFGREGESFQMRTEDNDTAGEIARLVGQADWNLPIYNLDGFEGWEYMQYYDIPAGTKSPPMGRPSHPPQPARSATPNPTGSSCSTTTPKSAWN